MCGVTLSGKRDAAAELANILNTIITDSTYGGAVLPSSLRELIRNRWDEICCLAHQIHDEETSEKKKLDRAIAEVECMDAASLRGVLAGIESEETTNLVKFYAKKVLEIK